MKNGLADIQDFSCKYKFEKHTISFTCYIHCLKFFQMDGKINVGNGSDITLSFLCHISQFNNLTSAKVRLSV